MESIKTPKTLVEQTYEILLDAICTGELAPGERLAQDQIAAKLNVSRQPVNSAISILKANRFVEDTGRRGVIVSQVDTNLFRSIYEFRSVIEPFAVTLAGARLTENARMEAELSIGRGRQAASRRDALGLLRADVEFHSMIYRWSGNPVIENSMQVNWHHIRRSMAQVLRDPDAAAPVWDEHEAIVEALLAGRTKDAAALMKRHIEGAYRQIVAATSAEA
ncbi:HTH-type transcriptional repressor RspR [Defluviimonas aquaemixtae]|uniref:HTH-type transcriptional repressor RspR n=1 Tax=Albidovulum aquaemixtae TaxID=1542388 RepID=A0A2R8BLI8_9RHOB|nr:GntR family transcriptional regulator [Defluviimonas aquaemixtae]SPH24240.1 HTH-type transcriptional repressor RspR [Defluviimonas aquaemixtae]